MNEIPPPIDSPPPDYNTAVNGPQNPIGKLINKYLRLELIPNSLRSEKTVPNTGTIGGLR